MILFIDNYDSFVHNLARYFRRLGQETFVVRNDALTLGEVRTMQPAAIVLSPGPCTPSEAGISLAVVRELFTEFPILGVCLGHQTIAQAFGGTITRAPEPMHGRTSEVIHNERGVFAGLPNPLTACRYHSLAIDEGTLPDQLQVTARTHDGVIMGIQHQDEPVVGVQYHPEAILTEGGFSMVANFLKLAGIDFDVSHLPTDELLRGVESVYQPPSRPVTF